MRCAAYTRCGCFDSPLALLLLTSLQGMESYCVRSFAEALEIIPYTLAENAGLNPIEIVTELRNHHANGRRHHGGWE
jgi:chaperonin GroEL (HSP60 family)